MSYSKQTTPRELAAKEIEQYIKENFQPKPPYCHSKTAVYYHILNVLEDHNLVDVMMNEDVIKPKVKRVTQNPLAGKPEYRDSRGRLPHTDWCRSNRMGPCNCGRGY